MISAILQTHIEVYADRIRGSARLLELARAGHLTPDMILAYQASLRYLVGHTEPHLERAQQRARELGRTDLEGFFAHKLLEEAGHERWAQNDLSYTLRLFGRDGCAGPRTAIVELVEFLWRTIELHPTRYLAYILFTEYFTVLMGPECLKLLERYGLPAAAMTLVDEHVELDREHAAEGLRQIDALASDDQDLGLLEDTLFRSMAYIERFYAELADVPSQNQASYVGAP